MSSYAELHCHSAFSLLDGASTPETLVRRAAQLGIRVLALTDHDDLGGAVRFSAAARNAGVEAIIGAELTVTSPQRAPDASSHLTLLARTAEGYANLSELISRARMGSAARGSTRRSGRVERSGRPEVWAPDRGRPRVSWDDLAELGAGLFALTGCPQGELARRVRVGEGKGARELLDYLRSIFHGYVAVEVWDHALPEERELANALVELADRQGLSAVATNDVHYANPSGRIVHDVLTCLRHRVTLEEAGTRLRPNGEWHLKPPSAVWRRWRQRPDVVRNTLAVAAECPFRLTDLSPEMPGFQVPAGMSRQDFLERLVWRGAVERYGRAGRLRNGDPIHVADSGEEGGAGGSSRSMSRDTMPDERAGPRRSKLRSTTPRAPLTGRDPSSRSPRPDERRRPPDRSGSRTYKSPDASVGRRRDGGQPGPSASQQTVAGPDRGATDRNDTRRIGETSSGGGTPHAGGATRGGSSSVIRSASAQPPHPASCRATWSERTPPASPATGGLTQRIRNQIRHELSVIERLDLAGYFLTVWDIVRYARRRGILLQGRGSAANSCVCYCLGVTAVDPIKFELLFERFLSEERGGAPDIDLDIEHERREEVLQYVYDRYGRDRAGMVCETITYRGRSAARDAARVLGFSTDVADRLAAEADRHEAADAAEALESGGLTACGLDPQDTRVRALVRVIRGLDRLPRHRSIHVGGFVLTRGLLSRVVPIEPASMPDRTVIQWDKDDLELAGLIKIDLLGLGMLTCLSKAIRYIRENRRITLDLAQLPAEDAEVFEMIRSADTVGLFQIESRAQMNSLPRLRPENFYDLVVQVAIIRPGPIQGDMVHPYIRRRRGEEPVTYLHPSLEPILHRTLGVPLFQEQGMKVAVAMAGFSPGQADTLRRAMGFKRSREAMAAIEPTLREGMTRRGVSPETQDYIVKYLTAFANYGFPESHAASFALLVYASAYLKRYYAPEFYCALLNSQPMGFYAPGTLVQDARRHDVEVRPVDLARSSWDCTLELDGVGAEPEAGSTLDLVGGQGVLSGRAAPITDHRSPITEAGRATGLESQSPALRIGLRYVRGLGAKVKEELRMAWEQGGPFRSVEDVVRRSGLGLPALKTLAEAGAFDTLWGPGRRSALWEVLARLADMPLAPVEDAEQVGPSRSSAGTSDASDETREACESVAEGARGAHPKLKEMSRIELIATDYMTTGLCTHGHPMEHLRAALRARGVLSAEELGRIRTGQKVQVAGVVICRQRPGTARGVCFITLEDETGFSNFVVYPDLFKRYRRTIVSSPVLLIEGVAQNEQDVVNVQTRCIAAIEPSAGAATIESHDFH